MKAVNITEKLNFVPVKLKMLFEDTELAIGTGFFYRFADTTHLVTNWHNVTGRHPHTNAPLHTEGGVPDRMVIGFPHRIQKEAHHHAIGWEWRVIRLYEDNEMHCPTWYEHPHFQQRVDVVTMPISELEITAVLPANDSSLDLARLRLYPSLDVFILGFPKGMSGGGNFRSGSVAVSPRS